MPAGMIVAAAILLPVPEELVDRLGFAVEVHAVFGLGADAEGDILAPLPAFGYVNTFSRVRII